MRFKGTAEERGKLTGLGHGEGASGGEGEALKKRPRDCGRLGDRRDGRWASRLEEASDGSHCDGMEVAVRVS